MKDILPQRRLTDDVIRIRKGRLQLRHCKAETSWMLFVTASYYIFFYKALHQHDITD